MMTQREKAMSMMQNDHDAVIAVRKMEGYYDGDEYLNSLHDEMFERYCNTARVVEALFGKPVWKKGKIVDFTES